MTMLKRIEGDRFHTVRSDGQPGHEMVFQRDADGRVSHLAFHSITLPRM